MAVIDAVIPARNEAPTIAANVAAASGCRHVREVIVVDDGSTDATADLASEAGAKVISRDGSLGSKAHAMAAGVAAGDAEAILFVDADCTGLTAAHLDEIVAPFVAGRAAMSCGMFDYGRLWNPVVLRWVPLTGERIVPRWIFERIGEDKLDGYTIELRINEVVAASGLRTVVRTMRGVSQRTKRDKLGPVEGLLRSWQMFRDLYRLVHHDLHWRLYGTYLRHLTVERS